MDLFGVIVRTTYLNPVDLIYADVSRDSVACRNDWELISTRSLHLIKQEADPLCLVVHAGHFFVVY